MTRLILVEKDGARKAIDPTTLQAHILVGWSLDVNFLLGEIQWDDLRFPATGINPPGAASDPTRDSGDGRMVFSATATNTVAMQVQMPHGWKLDSEIHPHIHWSPTTTNGGNCLWQLEYQIADVNDAFPGVWTTLTVLQAAGGTVDKHQLASFPAIDMAGKNLSSMILMKLSRMGADGTDTFTGTAKLNEFDVHVQLDAIGSNEELTK